MNIVLILVDSLNKEALRLYNEEAVCRTPVLDGFGAKSIVFDNHFIASLPCMPARREISAGRKEFMWRPWGPLEIYDPRMPVEVKKQGYNTGLVTDHYHYWEETANGYIQGFSSTEFIRGHETDYWRLPEPGPVPAWVDKMSEFRSPQHMRQYYANVKDRQGEQDFFPAKTFSAAANWLDENADKGPFFLQIESFDVHEPFHVPEPYASMYTDSGSADEF
ncbi:MAG: sulfatase-like hydrolase/transferase, partial [Pseudomonadota bacterium]